MKIHEEESSAPSTKDSPSDSVNGFQNNERDSQEVQQESKDSENRTETDTSEDASSLLPGGKNELNSQNCVEELLQSHKMKGRIVVVLVRILNLGRKNLVKVKKMQRTNHLRRIILVLLIIGDCLHLKQVSVLA